MEEAAAPLCAGTFTSVVPWGVVMLPGRPEGPWLAKGWAWDVARAQPAKLVAIVDGGGRVLDFGLSGFKDPKGRSSYAASGWSGLIDGDIGTKVRAFAILDDGRHACLLSREHGLIASMEGKRGVLRPTISFPPSL